MSDKLKQDRIIGIFIIVLAALLRLYQLGLPSLWFDESFTWYIVRLPWGQVLETILPGTTPPVYYMSTKVIFDLLGDSEVSLRLISAIAGIVSMYLAWLLGKQAAGRLGGWAGAWLVGVHPKAVQRVVRDRILWG